MRYKVKIPSREDWLDSDKLFQITGSIVCYTDGSKRDGQDPAFVCNSNAFLFRCHSVNNWAHYCFPVWSYSDQDMVSSGRDQWCSSKVHIYIWSDSQFELRAVESRSVTSGILNKCRDALNRMTERMSVLLFLVYSVTQVLKVIAGLTKFPEKTPVVYHVVRNRS